MNMLKYLQAALQILPCMSFDLFILNFSILTKKTGENHGVREGRLSVRERDHAVSSLLTPPDNQNDRLSTWPRNNTDALMHTRTYIHFTLSFTHAQPGSF